MGGGTPKAAFSTILASGAHCEYSCANMIFWRSYISCKKKIRDFQKLGFEPLDLSDHHQNLYTCSEREYCIPPNFHRDRTTPAYFLGFSCSRGAPAVRQSDWRTGGTQLAHRESTEMKKWSTVEWSDHGENLSECSTHVLNKCTNFGDDPISLRVRKPNFWKIANLFFKHEM